MLTKLYSTVLLSDQLYTWSDEYTKRTRCRTAKTAQRSGASTASNQIDPARLPHRAIQTMWQAGMQMRRWPRPRPQVLSIGELPRPTAANGLRDAGSLRANGRVSCQLSPDSRDSGADLRDQPRAAASSRGALERCHGRTADHSTCLDRCGIGWRTSRQYARRLARRPPAEFVFRGGSR